jgi:predicted DsbA family dithiol-disulfide isomerase
MQPVRFTVWSDYLCPWCYNGAVRVEKLRREFDGRIEFSWKSFLLRPADRGRRDPERFRAYTQSWLRPAAEDDSGTFRVWEGDAGPPTHSVPPHRVAKAAAEVEGFDLLHPRLLNAYFAENRDVSDENVLREIWDEAGLPEAGFARAWDDDILSRVLAEHDEALAAGVTGVPSMRLEGNDVVIVGAQPLEILRRWTQRALDGRI